VVDTSGRLQIAGFKEKTHAIVATRTIKTSGPSTFLCSLHANKTVWSVHSPNQNFVDLFLLHEAV